MRRSSWLTYSRCSPDFVLFDAAIEAARDSLAGKTLLVAGQDLQVKRSLPHGHVAAVLAQSHALGLPALLGPAGRQRDLMPALVVAPVCRPGSKLATTRWWTDTTLAADLGIADAGTDEVYAAMDWLAGRQDSIETALARRHLDGTANPNRLALFDLSSSWMTGSHCPLAARGPAGTKDATCPPDRAADGRGATISAILLRSTASSTPTGRAPTSTPA
ncbi:MAG: hypothetical protein ACR2K2_12795 [Mycobacteriales bacterium]